MNKYSYGNANLYIRTSARLSYLPVQPEESSTGMYSGGEPFEALLRSNEYYMLKDLLEQALSEKNSHINERVKMSSKILRLTPTDTTSAIIRPGDAVLFKIENQLKKFKQQN